MANKNKTKKFLHAMVFVLIEFLCTTYNIGVHQIERRDGGSLLRPV